jgi:hypothetical protein
MANTKLSRPEFEKTFDILVDDLLKHCEEYKLPDQALQWFKTVRNAAFKITTCD